MICASYEDWVVAVRVSFRVQPMGRSPSRSATCCDGWFCALVRAVWREKICPGGRCCRGIASPAEVRRSPGARFSGGAGLARPAAGCMADRHHPILVQRHGPRCAGTAPNEVGPFVGFPDIGPHGEDRISLRATMMRQLVRRPGCVGAAVGRAPVERRGGDRSLDVPSDPLPLAGLCG